MSTSKSGKSASAPGADGAAGPARRTPAAHNSPSHDSAHDSLSQHHRIDYSNNGNNNNNNTTDSGKQDVSERRIAEALTTAKTGQTRTTETTDGTMRSRSVETETTSTTATAASDTKRKPLLTNSTSDNTTRFTHAPGSGAASSSSPPPPPQPAKPQPPVSAPSTRQTAAAEAAAAPTRGVTTTTREAPARAESTQRVTLSRAQAALAAERMHLLKPLRVGKLTLANRLVMAPLTRVRAEAEHVPGAAMARYYADRAGFGLIIAEATQIEKGYSCFGHEPGIYGREQVEGWRAVTAAVHDKGGAIFCQLHHGGRATIQHNLDTDAAPYRAREKDTMNCNDNNNNNNAANGSADDRRQNSGTLSHCNDENENNNLSNNNDSSNNNNNSSNDIDKNNNSSTSSPGAAAAAAAACPSGGRVVGPSEVGIKARRLPFWFVARGGDGWGGAEGNNAQATKSRSNHHHHSGPPPPPCEAANRDKDPHSGGGGGGGGRLTSTRTDGRNSGESNNMSSSGAGSGGRAAAAEEEEVGGGRGSSNALDFYHSLYTDLYERELAEWRQHIEEQQQQQQRQYHYPRQSQSSAQAGPLRGGRDEDGGSGGNAASAAAAATTTDAAGAAATAAAARGTGYPGLARGNNNSSSSSGRVPSRRAEAYRSEPYPRPAALTPAQIRDYVRLYAAAAKNAMAAGFDGVQIHAGSGTLPNQFLCTSSNTRADAYGGSVEKRCRFLFEVVEAVVAAVGAERVALRISPLDNTHEERDRNPELLTRYICKRLSAYKLAFLDVMRGDFFSDARGADVWARESYEGVLLSGMGYDVAEAEAAVAEKKCDAVVFGVKAIANPDLPLRVAVAAAEPGGRGGAACAARVRLNELRPGRLYTRYDMDKGYNDYPFL